jgi:protein SCO1/2
MFNRGLDVKKQYKLIWLVATLLLSAVSFAGELPDNSIYHVGSNWLDQDNQSFPIDELQGKIQVVAFVYTYCERSCPIILARLKALKSLLPEGHSKQVQFLLISLDPERDTPSVLRTYMQDKELEKNEWRMLNGSSDDVLELAALVGVKYKPMDLEGKDIAHSNMITVLDKKGRLYYQMKGLNESVNEVEKTIGQLVVN